MHENIKSTLYADFMSHVHRGCDVIKDAVRYCMFSFIINGSSGSYWLLFIIHRKMLSGRRMGASFRGHCVCVNMGWHTCFCFNFHSYNSNESIWEI